MDRRGYLAQLLLPQLIQVIDLPASPEWSSASPEVEITDKVFFDLRISRQDGSTYVRDDLPDTFENRVLKARLVIGLYGNQAPK
jgi:hypothetical protein